MHDSLSFRISVSLRLLALSLCLLLFGCGRDPEGSYEGEISDWVRMVYKSSKDSTELVLTQSDKQDASGPAVLSKPEGKWEGSWSAESGKRRIVLNGNVYYLSKRTAFHELKAKDSGSKDEIGSPLTLTLNKGLSKRHSLPVSFVFKDETVKREAGSDSEQGTWEATGEGIIARFENEERKKIERFHFSWDQDDLLLRKITIIIKGDKNKGGKTQRMVYDRDEIPKFRHRGPT